jgi:HAMP domain-containing protein
VNPLRSVGARLSLALLLVVAGSLTAVYLVVIPSLESRLIDSKITQLEQTVKSETLRTDALAHEINHDPFWFQDQRETTNARLVFFEVLTNEPRALKVTADSSGGRNSLPVEGDPVALRASVSGQPHHGTVKRSGVRYAEVAWPYPNGWVLMLSAPLGDALESVSVAKQRLLLAGGIVLGVVLVVGYFAASLFARRIRRLERAAERIASGRFDEPIVDSGRDEVGNLARGFERMRLRLAQLDGARREFIANASHELRTCLLYTKTSPPDPG